MSAPRKRFFPEQVFKDTLGVFVAFVALFVTALVAHVPLERLADPTDTAYIPRPEWYFLFLFQMLKFFKGPLEIFGSTVLPGLAVLVLFVVPFLDRGPMVRLAKRTFAFLFVALGALAWAGLTAAAVVTTPPQTESADVSDSGQIAAWQQLSPPVLAGLGYFRQQKCRSCHPGEGKKGNGPDLTRVSAAHRDKEWQIAHFKDVAAKIPGGASPPTQLSTAQLNDLTQFVLKITGDDEADFNAAPQPVVEGAMLYEAQHCGACHMVNEVGMKVGPPLNGVSEHRDRAWLEEHFRDPKKMSPGSIMPAYKFNAQDMDHMIRFLQALPPAT